jgi:hypothetical protein
MSTAAVLFICEYEHIYKYKGCYLFKYFQFLFSSNEDECRRLCILINAHIQFKYFYRCQGSSFEIGVLKFDQKASK